MELKTFLFKFSIFYNVIPVRFLMKLSGKKIIFPFYHYVEKPNEQNHLTSNLYKTKKISDFIKDIHFLKKNLTSISIEDLQKNNIAKNSFNFLLSFDDGLSNFFHVVAPILEREKIDTINFISSNFFN